MWSPATALGVHATDTTEASRHTGRAHPPARAPARYTRIDASASLDLAQLARRLEEGDIVGHCITKCVQRPSRDRSGTARY